MNRKNLNISLKKEHGLKKICVLAATAMLLFGLLVGGTGLLFARKNPQVLEESGRHSWYRTFSISQDSWWIGVDFTEDSTLNLVQFRS